MTSFKRLWRPVDEVGVVLVPHRGPLRLAQAGERANPIELRRDDVLQAANVPQPITGLLV